MKIDEYQAKDIFEQYGIPVTKGRMARTAQEAKIIAEELGSTVVVKAQVHVGGRGKAGVESQGLSGYVTCWGSGGVNVNTAPVEVLDAVLADVAPGKADVLIKYRTAKEFESIAEVVQVLGLDGPAAEPLAGRLTFTGGIVQVTVTTRSGPSRLVTHAVVDPGSDGKGIIRLCRRSP